MEKWIKRLNKTKRLNKEDKKLLEEFIRGTELNTDNWLKRLERTKWMSDNDKVLFVEFARDAELKQIGKVRLAKYLTDLCIGNSMSGDNLTDMLKSINTLENTVRKINANKKYKFATKKNCKRTLGSIFCFLHYKDRSLKYAPKEVKELTSHIAKPSDKRLARPVIKREEVREMLKFANTRDKCLLMLLYESGCRISEIVAIQKNDITIYEEGTEIKVNGKTGEREVFIVEATKYLTRWLEEHPIKGKNAMLFPRPDASDKQITGAGLAKAIRSVVARMNLDRKKNNLPLFTKPLNPHNFRHSRASELGAEPSMNEAILCKLFGWEIGGGMPKIYIHLTKKQVKRAVLATYGRATPEEATAIITIKTCPKCHEDNPITLSYCGKCGYDLIANKMPSKIESLEERIRQLEAGRWKRLETGAKEIKGGK